MPDPLGEPPYHYLLETALPGISASASKQGKLVFHVVGDVGGIKQPDYQRGVAAAMKGDLMLGPGLAPSFFYLLGDVVYYNGQIIDYYDQFYEPYETYTAPILAIPGNHDGDPFDATQTSLDGWVRYFMDPTPEVRLESHDAPRVTISLPNVYYTLDATTLGLNFTDSNGTIDVVAGTLSLSNSISLPDSTTLTLNGSGTLLVPSLDAEDSAILQNSGTLSVTGTLEVGDHGDTGASYVLAGGIHKSESAMRRIDIAEFLDWCVGCDIDPIEAFRKMIRKH